MAKIALRTKRGKSVVALVASGEIDTTNIHRFEGYLRRLEGQTPALLVDLSSVTRCEPALVAALKRAQKRAELADTGVAVVADERAACYRAIQADQTAHGLRTFPTAHSALEWLEHR